MLLSVVTIGNIHTIHPARSRGHCSTALLPLCWQYETPGNLLGLLLLRQSPQLWTATAIELVYICSMSKWIRWNCSCHLNYTLADMFIYVYIFYILCHISIWAFLKHLQLYVLKHLTYSTCSYVVCEGRYSRYTLSQLAFGFIITLSRKT